MLFTSITSSTMTRMPGKHLGLHRVRFNPPVSRCRSVVVRAEAVKTPKVGIGIVLLRKQKNDTQVLLVRRSKAPLKDLLAFPGGHLEFGETLVECCSRELMEETGLKFLKDTSDKDSPSNRRSLRYPRPVSTLDGLYSDDNNPGKIAHHYAVIHMGGLPEDPSAVPVAGDDAKEVLWMSVQDVFKLTDLAPDHAQVISSALSNFDIPTR